MLITVISPHEFFVCVCFVVLGTEQTVRTAVEEVFLTS